MTSTLDRLPELGVGVVWLPGLERELGPTLDGVDVIEIEPETRWIERPCDADRYAIAALDEVGRLPQPKIAHGIGAPVGGTWAPDSAHARCFRASVDRLDAAWASEHLSFNRFVDAGVAHHTGFFLPPLRTAAGLAVCCAALDRLAKTTGRVVLFETPVDYLARSSSQADDGSWFARVAEAADVGILLDLHNLYANEKNGGTPMREVIAKLPLGRVVELHLAGGLEYGGFWLDAHSGTPPEPVLQLARELVPRLPSLKAIVLEILPSFLPYLAPGQLLASLDELRQIWATRGRDAADGARVHADELPHGDVEPHAWERALGRLVVHGRSDDAIGEALRDNPGVPLYYDLVRRFRAGTLADQLPHALRAMGRRGKAWVQCELRAYFDATTPEPFEPTEALRFAAWLSERHRETELPDLLAFDAAMIEASRDGETREASLRRVPEELRELIPGVAADEPVRVLVEPR